MFFPANTAPNTGQGLPDWAIQTNNALISWYATITQKPIQQPSVLQQAVGVDLGQAASSGALGIVGLLVVVGAVLLFTRGGRR